MQGAVVVEGEVGGQVPGCEGVWEDHRQVSAHAQILASLPGEEDSNAGLGGAGAVVNLVGNRKRLVRLGLEVFQDQGFEALCIRGVFDEEGQASRPCRIERGLRLASNRVECLTLGLGEQVFEGVHQPVDRVGTDEQEVAGRGVEAGSGPLRACVGFEGDVEVATPEAE